MNREEAGDLQEALWSAEEMHDAVHEHFAGATTLSTFYARTGELTSGERKQIVEQALILIEQNYAHLPLKRAMHSVDPVQRLKLLLQAVQRPSPGEELSEIEFQQEMTDIFTSVRDLHTNYLLPDPYRRYTAFLPVMVEDYFEAGERRYVVSHIASGFSDPHFRQGVEVLYWNGVPIHRAVLNAAERYAGSNRAAQHARGVQALTTRALVIARPPDEEWVVVGYRTQEGALREIRLDWMVNPPLPPTASGAVPTPAAFASLGLDLEQEVVQRIRRPLFAPQSVAQQHEAERKEAEHQAFGRLESRMPEVFQARAVRTPQGEFGYLRIRTFNSWPPEQFVAEVIRLVSQLPRNGLIIDVRGNGGGVIMNGELILQLLTPRRIEPEPVQFLNTPLNLEICRRHGRGSQWADLSPWVESMELALKTGSTFSAGFPITDREQANAIGQKYFGPVVLIVDALCYSTTDIFAAGFQDHEIGPVLGVHGNTGAGGANVWTHEHLHRYILPGENSVYEPLPRGAGMRVSMRRTLRVHRRAGTPVEDLGVVPDERHFMTRRDLLEGNPDLIEGAAALLAGRPVRGVELKLKPASVDRAEVVLSTRGMTRVDAYVGDRPLGSYPIEDDRVSFTLEAPARLRTELEVRGFDGDRLVARYRYGGPMDATIGANEPGARAPYRRGGRMNGVSKGGARVMSAAQLNAFVDRLSDPEQIPEDEVYEMLDQLFEVEGDPFAMHYVLRDDVAVGELESVAADALEAAAPSLRPVMGELFLQGGALLDAPDGFELSRAAPDLAVVGAELAIASYLKSLPNRIKVNRRNARFRERVRRYPNEPVLIAEGDSWFVYPWRLRDTIEQLSEEHSIYNVGAAGDELQDMVHNQLDYLRAVGRLRSEGFQPRALLISGGGNDILGPPFKSLLRPYFPGDNPERLLYRNLVDAALERITDLYSTLFDAVLQHQPQLAICVHGYDYALPGAPRYALPPGVGGKWLVTPLRRAGIHDQRDQQGIVRVLVDRFNEKLRDLVDEKNDRREAHQRIHFIDARDTVQGAWANEIHPNDFGFARVAARFDEVLRGLGSVS